jgi:hypothetical protein
MHSLESPDREPVFGTMWISDGKVSIIESRHSIALFPLLGCISEATAGFLWIDFKSAPEQLTLTTGPASRGYKVSS